MKLILFDCDGTIVDSQHMIVAAMEGAFNSAGLPLPPRAEILSVVGLSLVPAVARLLPRGSEGAHSDERVNELANDLAQSYKQAFHALRADPANHEPLYLGARHVIESFAARDDVVLGIATGKSRRGVDLLFEREGLAGLFSTIQTADDHPSKPHPSMVLKALAETAVAPADAVMVGDTTFDMHMARAAGVVPLGVGWGYHDVAALHAAGAWCVLAGYHELPDAVDRTLAEAATQRSVR